MHYIIEGELFQFSTYKEACDWARSCVNVLCVDHEELLRQLTEVILAILQDPEAVNSKDTLKNALDNLRKYQINIVAEDDDVSHEMCANPLWQPVDPEDLVELAHRQAREQAALKAWNGAAWQMEETA